MNYKTIFILIPLIASGCESAEQLNKITTLSGPYCNDASVSESIATCLCYDYSPDGTFEWTYGSSFSKPKPAQERIFGSYVLDQRKIKIELAFPGGKDANEVMQLISSKRIRAEDKLVLTKKKEIPKLCLGQ